TGNLATISEASGTILSTYDGFYGLRGLSAASGVSKVFGRTTGVSPSDIHALPYNASGSITADTDSPYHGDYADAARTWVYPNGNWVVEDTGIVYTTSALTYVASLGGRFSGMTFAGDTAYVS